MKNNQKIPAGFHTVVLVLQVMLRLGSLWFAWCLTIVIAIQSLGVTGGVLSKRKGSVMNQEEGAKVVSIWLETHSGLCLTGC